MRYSTKEVGDAMIENMSKEYPEANIFPMDSYLDEDSVMVWDPKGEMLKKIKQFKCLYPKQ